MRVLILGGGGMLGHKLWQSYRERFDTWVTVRSDARAYAGGQLFDASRTISGVDALHFDSVVRALAIARPTVIINCVGIIKQVAAAKDPLMSVGVNSLFPHRLEQLSRAVGARLIHISTDCVFSGRKGNYVETDPSDAEDLYGRTKFLGEIAGENALTLRTSIIGRELSTASGLVEWFLRTPHERVRGYTRALFTGLTTNELADVIAEVITRHKSLSGVYHVASTPISKYDLLVLLNDVFGRKIEVEREETVVIDRRLDGTRFREQTGYVSASWPEMLARMASDVTPYDEWRRSK
jgi:dTDP-4-dehydrorhamnose reductase